jgi:hypothetical protein
VPILSTEQIVTLAAQAGFEGADLATAAAIALAETLPPGNSQSYNPELKAGAAPGQGSYGLWQIYLTMHPEFDAQQLLDPGTNAAAAYQIYSRNGYSFRPWSTYGNGKYLSFLPQVQAAIAAMTPAAQPDQPATDGTIPSSGDSSGSGNGGAGPVMSFALVGTGLLLLAAAMRA